MGRRVMPDVMVSPDSLVSLDHREHPAVVRDALVHPDRRDRAVTKGRKDRRVWMDSMAKRANVDRWVLRVVRECRAVQAQKVCPVTRATRESPVRLDCRVRRDLADTLDNPAPRVCAVNRANRDTVFPDRRVMPVWLDSLA